jgi:hypothetical protein
MTACNKDRCSDSQNLSVSVECGPLSTTIFLNYLTINYEFRQYDTSNNTINFEEFSCTNK